MYTYTSEEGPLGAFWASPGLVFEAFGLNLVTLGSFGGLHGSSVGYFSEFWSQNESLLGPFCVPGAQLQGFWRLGLRNGRFQEVQGFKM